MPSGGGIQAINRVDFDQYLFEKRSQDKGTICSQLAGVLDSLYRREPAPYLMDDKLVQYRGGAELPSLDAKPHVFFKWRCFDASLPGSELIAEVLRKTKSSLW